VAHAHNDFTKPYCAAMRAALIHAADATGATLHPAGVYLCVDGPRFETAAEVRLFASWGADLIGMTGAPEAVLAREAGLCYAPVAVVGNLGAGLGGSISHTAVAEACQAATAQAVGIILEAIGRIDAQLCTCPCVVPPEPPLP
jgi:5'-methylthioadenosine phosphorylase